MLPTCILLKYNIRPSNGALFQWLKVNVKWCSSSDSSSDSDSDSEKEKQKRYVKSKKPTLSDNKSDLGNFLNNMIQTTSLKTAKNVKKTPLKKVTEVQQDTKTITENVDLTEYLNNMLKARKLQKTIDVAMPKKKSNAAKPEKKIPYEKRLVSAAENVATSLGGDKAKTTSDLLEKAFLYKTKSFVGGGNKQLKDINNIKSDEDSVEFTNKLSEDAETRQASDYKSFANERQSMKKSVIQTLLQEYNQRPTDSAENSISQKLLSSSKNTSTEQFQNIKKINIRQDVDIWNGKPNSVFGNMGVMSPNTPELKTWAALEQRELKALTTYSPANIFQELILWTEQGKLWKFPIDNEQGLEEERNVHFSEHVFMERHLKEWCPKSGPIRHFMELVCNGLSKNPYLTVQEKINHIIWYKEYFASKQDLLQELGAIQESFPDKAKQITE